MKTTPSIKVSGTTYYGSLTTCVSCASKPDCGMVTFNNTTYYTTAPSKGTQFINWVTPAGVSIPSNTIKAVCCTGFAGDRDYIYDGKICSTCTCAYVNRKFLSTGYVKDAGCGTVLVKNEAGATCYLSSAGWNHTHEVVCMYYEEVPHCCNYVNLNYQGVYAYCNYWKVPDCAITFSCKKGSVPYEYLMVNCDNNNCCPSAVCSYQIRPSYLIGWMTCFTENYYTIPYCSMCGGGASITLYCSCIYNPGFPQIWHRHASLCLGDNARNCYCSGCGLGMNYILGACYNNDLDALDSGTILFTNCPIDCFNTDCWCLYRYMPPSLTGSSAPWRNCDVSYFACSNCYALCICCSTNNFGGGIDCPNNQGRTIPASMYPSSCLGKATTDGYCFCPIVSKSHTHDGHNPFGYCQYGIFCMDMARGPESTCSLVDTVSLGVCAIIHK